MLRRLLVAGLLVVGALSYAEILQRPGGVLSRPISEAGVSESPSSLLTGLEHSWPLNEVSGNRADEVGGATLTDNNTVGSIFNGPATVATFPAGEKLTKASVSLAADFTVAGWIRQDVDGGYPILFQVTNGGHEQLSVYSQGGGTWVARAYDTSSNLTLSTKNSVAMGVWHLWIAEYDSATKKISFWVDDSAGSASSALVADRWSDAGTLTIGGLLAGTANLEGAAGCYGVWSTLLDSGQRTALLNAGVPLPFASLPGSLTTGLTHYWDLDDTADSVGTWTLTNSGSVTFGANADAPFGVVASFVAANNEYLSNLSLSNPGDCSIAVWFKADTSGLYGPFLLGNGNYNAGRLMSYIFGSNLYMETNNGSVVTTNMPVTNGNWYFLVMNYNATAHQMSWSLNGSALTSTAAGSSDRAVDRIFVGSLGSTPVDPYNSRMSRVLVYSRALSSDEITCLYDAGVPVDYPFTGICAP